MSLRYIVPSLGLIACAAGSASAADVGGLTINGYVDTILEVSSIDDNLRGAKDGTIAMINGDEASNVVIDFYAAAQIEAGYTIGDVKGNIEVFWDDDGSVTLEQAYAKWAVTESVDIKMGKFHNGIGWEGYDAPELYRINTSLLNNAVPIMGMDATGVRVGFKGPEGDIAFSGGVSITDGYYDIGAVEAYANGIIILGGGTPGSLPGKDNDELGVGFDATLAVADIGTFDVDVVFDQGAGYDAAAGESDDAFGVDFSGTITALADEPGLLFGYDLNYTSYGEMDVMGILAIGNYKLPTDMPASISLMADYVDTSFDEADDFVDSASEMEVAVALLTNPTNEDHFATNLELRYITRDYEVGGTEAEDIDEFGIFLEMLAVIP